MTSLKLFGSNQKIVEYQSYPPHFPRGILALWVDQESVEDDGDCSEIMIIRMMITTIMMRIPDNDGRYLILFQVFKTMQCLNLENV